MTELQLRKTFVAKCKTYTGFNEYDGSHKTIIDLYNSIKPLPVNYKMSYKDPWCAAFVSAVAQALKITDVVFPECSCDRMISLYKRKGRWIEADNHKPNIGDIIMYDWDDSGNGDNVGAADHVGVVVAIDGSRLTIIEGNISNKVGYRTLSINGKFIRGYCLPDFASLADKVTEESDSTAERPVSVNAVAKNVSINVPQLAKNSKGASVRALQVLLISKGYNCGTYGADGDFGNATELAVKAFQKDSGLTVDGIAGKDTWSALITV